MSLYNIIYRSRNALKVVMLSIRYNLKFSHVWKCLNAWKFEKPSELFYTFMKQHLPSYNVLFSFQLLEHTGEV